MKKKITRSSFSALRGTARLMDEQEKRAVIGGDYWDDHGVWSTDSSGSMYWTRTSQGDGYYYGDSYGGSNGYNSGNGYYGNSGYCTQSEFYNWQGYVEGMGYVMADLIVNGNNSNNGGNSYPSQSNGDNFDTSNITFNTSGNTAFHNQLMSILETNSVIRSILSYHYEGYVGLTFGISDFGQVGNTVTTALTSFPNDYSSQINFNSNYMDNNGWKNPYNGVNNIGYDLSKARNMEEKLVITLVHEALHAKHSARYNEAMRIAKNRRGEAVQYLKNNGYSDEFIAIYFEKDATGAWVDADVNKRNDRQHAYYERYNQGVIDATLEEYRRDFGN